MPVPSRTADGTPSNEADLSRKQQVIREIQQDLAALDAYSDQHGSFAEHVRAHYNGDAT
jgi:hypothetical protein